VDNGIGGRKWKDHAQLAATAARKFTTLEDGHRLILDGGQEIDGEIGEEADHGEEISMGMSNMRNGHSNPPNSLLEGPEGKRRIRGRKKIDDRENVQVNHATTT
jgi:hypothetical protein